MKTSLGRLVVVLLLLLFSFTCVAQQTLTVPDDYLTIQAAIDAAQPGDTVSIAAGSYKENLVIDKPLSLVGEDRTTTIIRSSGSAQDVITVNLAQGNVAIQDIKVTGGYTGIRIYVDEGTQVRVNDVIVSENQYGVAAFGNGALVLTESYLIDNHFIGLLLSNSISVIKVNEILRDGIGILLVGTVNANLEDNLIGLCTSGIDTYTTACGYSRKGFQGRVQGARNRIYGIKTDLCPDCHVSPWPEGFINENWKKSIAEAVDYYNRGVALDKNQDHQGVLVACAAGLTLLDDAPFSFLRAYLDKNIGDAYTKLGRYEDALIAYESARVVCASYGMDVTVATTDQNIGIVYCSLGRYQEALAKFRSARLVFVSHEMDIAMAAIDQSIGVVYTELGQYEDALIAYKSARVVCISHRMEAKVAGIDHNIGIAYEELGRYEEALRAYECARAVYVKHEMEVDVAKIEASIGVLYSDLGRYEEGLAKFRSARLVFVHYKMDVDVAKTDQNIGVDYLNLSRYEDALAAYQSARAVYVEQEMEVNAAVVDQNIGVVYDCLGRYEDALIAYESARVVCASYGMDVMVATTDQNIGLVYSNLGRYEDALQAYEAAVAILDETPPAAGMTYSYPATRWVILENKGLCCEKQGNWEAAVKAYQDSIAVIESLRGYMKSEELKSAWQERTQDVYEHLIKLLIDQGQGVSAFPYAERCRARIFLDALYQGSITPNQLISPEAGISSGAVDPDVIDAALKDAQEDLQPNEAVLEYMVTDSGVYLWVITKNGIGDPVFIEYPREQLMNDVIRLRKSLESDPPDQITLTELLTSFYDKLLKEGLSKLPDGVDTLILIPSGPLWYVPFSALKTINQETGTTSYLIEHYTIAYLPSLASLSSLAEGETQSPSTPFMALANPTLSTEQIKELGTTKYQYAQLEDTAEAIRQRLAGQEKDVYVRGQAQEPKAYQEIPVHTVEFYGCHGAFNPKVPLQSKLFLGPGESGASSPDDERNPDGNYHAWEALLTDHRGTELVILGACESLLPAFHNMQNMLGTLSSQTSSQVVLTEQQLKQIVVGDEVVGLARAFLSSGAEAVLGTLW